MKIPKLEEALQLMNEAKAMNPGPWCDHSFYAARAAGAIAELHPELDSSNAYILGLLHDIGRREGMHQMRHILDGYKFLHAKGFDDAARICLTHSFPVKDIGTAVAKWDCPDNMKSFVDSYLSGIEYNEYDRLIQLCDYLALPSGFTLVEKRMIDVALRYGTNEYSILKWKEILNCRRHFDAKIGCPVYSILPGIVKNTFEFDPNT
ncbi:HD domain-containing protein [Anaerobacterium chartisolvens]|uniref:HD domain-containing protein n=1 Tax=Anaerobacterium chartisolvens TaxID=1297424 RepID=A0A369AYS1_9FIRM|nr:HD domain-containing protein [Anaerobacterium chartisolvens]RCX14313.1 HD domain-containing protein [Anaerobacterium chartisolvens]